MSKGNKEKTLFEELQLEMNNFFQQRSFETVGVQFTKMFWRYIFVASALTKGQHSCINPISIEGMKPVWLPDG